MLVLSRRKNEAIVIDGAIEVTVVQIYGQRVKLGITCSRDIPIYRSEIWAEIEEQTVSTDDSLQQLDLASAG